MGLYLAVFDGEQELEGVDVGHYADFGYFRDAVVREYERGFEGSRCPVLIRHSDCDGEWSPLEAAHLRLELKRIEEAFSQLPPIPLKGWKVEVAKLYGVPHRNLADCFFDVDGEPLIERLIQLATISVERQLPILFQ